MRSLHDEMSDTSSRVVTKEYFDALLYNVEYKIKNSLHINVTNKLKEILAMIDNYSYVASYSSGNQEEALRLMDDVAIYFLENQETLRIMLDAVNSKPDLIEIMLRIITALCRKKETMISSIGCNPKFVKSILSHLQLQDELVLSSLLRFLTVAVRTIRSDRTSRWIAHLKECPFFKRSILSILECQLTHSNEELIITATDLVKEIAETNLDQSNFLEEIYNSVEINIYGVIFTLMTCCKQMIQWKKENEERINLEFAHNWLSIMTTMKTYNQLPEREQGIFIKCLFLVMHPFLDEPIVLSLDQQITDVQPKFQVISKYALLLSGLNCSLSIPWIMNLILMKIILNLKSVLDAVSEKYRSEENEFLKVRENPLWENIQMGKKLSRMSDLHLSLRGLLQDLNEAWLNIAHHHFYLSIDNLVELIKPFNEEEYFLNLLNESRRFDLNSMKTINDKLKETGNDRKTFDDLLKESEENFMKYDSDSFHGWGNLLTIGIYN